MDLLQKIPGWSWSKSIISFMQHELALDDSLFTDQLSEHLTLTGVVFLHYRTGAFADLWQDPALRMGGRGGGWRVAVAWILHYALTFCGAGGGATTLLSRSLMRWKQALSLSVTAGYISGAMAPKVAVEAPSGYRSGGDMVTKS